MGRWAAICGSAAKAPGRAAALLTAALILAGCVGAAATRFADQLSAAILDQEDPELVRDGLPSYLILLDALVGSDPENPQYLGTAAQLYAAYGVAFVADNHRAETLTARARNYGSRAVCAADRNACQLDDQDYSSFVAVVDEIDGRQGEALYSYCVGQLAYIRSHAEDWNAVAALPKVEYALQHLLTRGGEARAANINTYLGILNTLRPEALGGKPETGRAYFEKALELSGGTDLTAKVEFARSYARLVYDRELHDRLLNEVLQAPVQAPGLTLFNTLAQQRARQLLESADDYF